MNFVTFLKDTARQFVFTIISDYIFIQHFKYDYYKNELVLLPSIKKTNINGSIVFTTHDIQYNMLSPKRKTYFLCRSGLALSMKTA